MSRVRTTTFIVIRHVRTPPALAACHKIERHSVRPLQHQDQRCRRVRTRMQRIAATISQHRKKFKTTSVSPDFAKFSDGQILVFRILVALPLSVLSSRHCFTTLAMILLIANWHISAVSLLSCSEGTMRRPDYHCGVEAATLAAINGILNGWGTLAPVHSSEVESSRPKKFSLGLGLLLPKSCGHILFAL